MNSWQLQDAQVRLEEVVVETQQTGPQEIVHDGDSVAVVVSRQWFDKHVILLDERNEAYSKRKS